MACSSLPYGLGYFAGQKELPRVLSILLSAAALILCALLTRVQVRHWSNTKTLFARAAAVTSNNFVAHSQLARALQEEGRIQEAIAQYDAAVQIEPFNGGGHTDRGLALASAGRFEEAIQSYQIALNMKPDFAPARENLGAALGELGR